METMASIVQPRIRSYSLAVACPIHGRRDLDFDTLQRRAFGKDLILLNPTCLRYVADFMGRLVL